MLLCDTDDALPVTEMETIGKLAPALNACFVPTHRKSSVRPDDIAAALHRYVTSRSRAHVT